MKKRKTMDDDFPITRLDNFSVTRLDDIQIRVLDDVQSSMSPNALVNRVFILDTSRRNIE
jgi:hypothetical protein